MILPRIVADENIPGEVVRELKNLGHKVYWIAAEKRGISDREVWEIAASQQALLLTRDDRFFPQLTKEEILNGPRVVVFVATGIENNELQAAEIMTGFVSWYFRNLKHNDWHYVNLAVNGKKKTRGQCWGEEQLRRNRR
jgi:predicted nuclease of predicted toxin-antitoxin system